MGILKNTYITIFLLFGLFIRLFLIQLPGFKIDVDAWFAWAQRVNSLGFANFYSTEVFTDYTPGFIYIFGFLGFVKNLFQIDNSSFYLLLKFPFIISELILALLIYKTIQKESNKWAFISFCLILLNPAFIFNSSIWGQLDSLLTLCLFLSVQMLSKHKLLLSSLYFGLAFLLKPQAVILIPVFSFYLIRYFSLRNLFHLILPSFVTVFIFSLPFFPQNPIGGFIQILSRLSSDYPYISLFAYNLWGIVGFWIADNTVWINITYQNLGYLLFTTYSFILLTFYLKKRISIYSLATLISLGLFFLLTRIHERYIYSSLVFLILIGGILKSRLILSLTIILSAINFLNLYYVYVYYNEIYLNLPKLLFNPLVYNILDQSGQNLSLLSTLIFVLLTIIILKYSYVHKEK